jgi:hypothetical protein
MNQTTRYGSLVTAVVALALTWHTVRATPAAMSQIRRKGADLEKLQGLQARTEQTFSAMKMLEDAGDPPAIADMLANRGAEVRPHEDAPLIEGWFLKSADVIFNEIALADAAGFMADAENQRPPWRVAECTITPGGAPGVGRVALVMESLEFKAP